MDKDTQQVQTAWGSFTETAFIDAGRPLAILKGSFAYLWAGAVLHVLGYDDVIAFLTHACKMLAEGGVFFGVSVSVLSDVQADDPAEFCRQSSCMPSTT